MRQKTFRLFISSTFNDLKEERNILQNEVFPVVRDFCRTYGYNFEPIDLRWGVTNEAGLDHQAIDICINEVKKLFNYPRPNFLVILADRYGWIPVPNKVESTYFTKLNERIDQEERSLLQKWYKEDTNSIPAYYILQPVDSILGSAKEAQKLWAQEEAAIREIFLLHENLFPASMLIGKSATEQEIIYGILESAQQMQNEDETVLCIERRICNEEEVEDAAFLPDNPEKLDALKRRLRSCMHPKVIYEKLQARLLRKEEGYRPDREYLEDFAVLVKNYLITHIQKEIWRLSFEEENEEQAHVHFQKERAEIFVGRDEQLAAVQHYITDDSRFTFVVYGESGVGKSAFMAMASKQAQNTQAASKVITRFIGISEISSQPKTLLENITKKIYQYIGKKYESSPKDYAQSVALFISALHEYAQKSDEKLILFIDALDQFETKNALEWVETQLPKNVKLILSTLEAPYGDYYDTLKTKTPKSHFVKVEKLQALQGKEILRAWLRNDNRTLTTAQLEHVLGLFKQNALPLFLKILFERARKWHSYDTDFTQLRHSDLIAAIRDYFSSLVYEKHHSKALVTHTLGYIGASKNGIAESELVEVLSTDAIVLHDISNPFHRLPLSQNATKLPSAVWSRLYYDLLKYLSFVEFDGVSLLNFYHRKIKECVGDYYYSTDASFFHAKLLEFFWNQPSVFTQNKKPNLRKLSELPHHTIYSESFSKFLELYSVEFMELKVQNNQKDAMLFELYTISQSLQKSRTTAAFKEEFLNTLVENLLAFLLQKVQNPSSSTLSVEELHAYFVYKSDKSFYAKVLQTAMETTRLEKIAPNAQKELLLSYLSAFSARYANMIRRDAKLEEASKIYEKLEKEGYIKLLDCFEQSRIYYDIGYIAYLGGKFDKAILFLHKSASMSKECGASVSRYISECVATRVEMLRYDKVEKFEKTLLEALDVFEQHKFDDPGAKRWIKNVHAHLFEVAYAKHDIESMRRYFDLLKNDEWMLDHQQMKKYSSFTPYEARIALVEKEYQKAVELFEGYIYGIVGDEERNKKESMARDYYDYLLALHYTNKKKFQQKREEAMALPDIPGNHLWKEKIAKIGKE